jgi:hypothetical protein
MRRPYRADPHWWAEEEVRPLNRGPVKFIVAHLSSSGWKNIAVFRLWKELWLHKDTSKILGSS